MNKANLILIGTGGHARACIDVIEQLSQFKIAGLIAPPDKLGTKQLGYSVIADDTDLDTVAKKYPYALIALGQILSADHRVRLYRLALEAGFGLPSVVSPTAYVSPHATIGAGTIVMHGAIINAGAIIGSNCIINSRALIEHDAQVSDHCHISTGAILNGDTSIGTKSFVGSSSTIKEGVTIGANSVIGMGLTVRRNLESNIKFLAHPV